MMSDPVCTASLEDDLFSISNNVISRSWRVDAQGLLTPCSFRDLRSGREWLDPQAEAMAILPEGELPVEPRPLSMKEIRGRQSVVEKESLMVELTATGVRSCLVTRFQMFPDCASVSIQLRCEGAGRGTQPSLESAGQEPTGVELADKEEVQAVESDVLDCLCLAPLHLQLTAVDLQDQTDRYDELVSWQHFQLHPYKGKRDFAGGLFAVENTLTGEGLVMVKEAPLPHACPVPVDAGMALRRMQCVFKGHGTGGDGDWGYRLTTLAYQGGAAGRVEVLQQWQRSLRSYVPGRDGLFLTNTWGDRSQDGRITEAFTLQELAAASEMGADVVQIDDGWQKGTSANSVEGGGVWIGFWDADPEFWQPHPQRLPNGLEPLLARARELEVNLGLWFAPDSANDFAHWKKDADCLLEFYHTHGIRFIKIDGVKALTKKAERNLRAFFDRVLEGSDGNVTFDLDVTAEIRPGYFGMLNVGAVFVENRYTDWGHYWPHCTLRNLWSLGQWVDPLRLRMEFLNHTRNQQKYRADDPLAPAAYRAEVLLATVLFCSPLGWFEVSNLPAGFQQEVKGLARLRRQYRDEWLQGVLLPVGARPDGVAWTGFASVSADRRSVTYLLFRELNPEESACFELPFGLSGEAVEVLAGGGVARLKEGRVLELTVPEKLGYGLVRVGLRAES